MTRLEEFAASLTQEMLQAYGDTKRAVTKASGYDTTCTPARAFEAAREACIAVATRRIREFATGFNYMDHGTITRYLDEPASALREEGPSSGREGKVPMSPTKTGIPAPKKGEP